MKKHFITDKEKDTIESIQNTENKKFNIGDSFYFLFDNKILKGCVDSIYPRGDAVFYFFSEYCFKSNEMYFTPQGLCDNLLEEYKFRTNNYK